MDKDVTILILSYNPIFARLLLTVNSALMQKGVSIEIIIADDGSKNNLFDELKQHFKEKNFSDYILVANEKNQGTVKNALSGAVKANGQYLKMIGVGDCLISETILRDWVDRIRSEKAVVSFGKHAAFRYDRFGKIEIFKRLLEPQNIVKFEKGGQYLREDYLLFNDLCCGAAVLGEAETLIRYLKIIEGKIIYGEDQIYRLMTYKNEKTDFYNKDVIFYECGDGVSTSSEKWQVILRNEWSKTNDILLSWLDMENDFDRKLYILIKENKEQGIKKLYYKAKRLLCIRGMILRAIKKRLRKGYQYTSMEYDEKFIENILKY